MTLTEEYFLKLNNFIDSCQEGKTKIQKVWLFYNSLFDKKVMHYDEEIKKERPMNSKEIIEQVLFFESMSDIEKLAKEAVELNPFDLEAWQYRILTSKAKKYEKLEMCHDVSYLAENELISLNVFYKACFNNEQFDYLISPYLRIKELYIEQLINCSLFAEAKYQANQLYYQDVRRTLSSKELLLGLSIALKEFNNVEKLYFKDDEHSLAENFLYTIYLVQNKNYLEAKKNLDNLYKLNGYIRELLLDFENVENKANLSSDGSVKEGSLEEAYSLVVDYQFLLPEIKELISFATEKETLIN